MQVSSVIMQQHEAAERTHAAITIVDAECKCVHHTSCVKAEGPRVNVFMKEPF